VLVSTIALGLREVR